MLFRSNAETMIELRGVSRGCAGTHNGFPRGRPGPPRTHFANRPCSFYIRYDASRFAKFERSITLELS